MPVSSVAEYKARAEAKRAKEHAAAEAAGAAATATAAAAQRVAAAKRAKLNDVPGAGTVASDGDAAEIMRKEASAQADSKRFLLQSLLKSQKSDACGGGDRARAAERGDAVRAEGSRLRAGSWHKTSPSKERGGGKHGRASAKLSLFCADDDEVAGAQQLAGLDFLIGVHDGGQARAMTWDPYDAFVDDGLVQSHAHVHLSDDVDGQYSADAQQWGADEALRAGDDYGRGGRGGRQAAWGSAHAWPASTAEAEFDDMEAAADDDDPHQHADAATADLALGEEGANGLDVRIAQVRRDMQDAAVGAPLACLPASPPARASLAARSHACTCLHSVRRQARRAGC
jgi:hypothetical protein